MKSSIILSAFLCLVVIACDSNRVYENNVALNAKTWLADSVINFKFDVKDSSQKYNIYYNLRNSISYPFQNIYVNYTLEDSSGNALKEALINRGLFHPKTGKPFGNGSIGDIFDHQFKLMENYKFDQPGVYQLKLQQFMRRDSLPEILSVGVRVEQAIDEE